MIATELIREFESMRNNAELQALSKMSLERELTDKELKRYKELMKTEYGG